MPTSKKQIPYPWENDEDAPRVPLTLGQIFSGFESELETGGDTWIRLASRILVILFMLTLVGSLVFNATVVAADSSARMHECEHNYMYWWMAVFNLFMHVNILFWYYVISNSYWMMVLSKMVMIASLVMVGWWLAAFVRMAHICTSFYMIKYPDLPVTAMYGMGMNVFCLVMSLVYQCSRPPPGSEKKSEDMFIYRNVFTRRDETWIPSLIHRDAIPSYRTGIASWEKCVRERNQTLQSTLDKTITIHQGSKNQSKLLTRVSDTIKETQEKVTKSDSLLKEQESLINDMHDTVNGAKEMLTNLPGGPTDLSLFDCTSGDVCKWSLIGFFCCISVALFLFAIPKWFHLLGIPINLVELLA